MSNEFERAPDVEAIGAELIEQYHKHLKEVRVEYVFGDEAPESNGMVTRGKAVKISGVDAELARVGEMADPFFCIIIYKNEWVRMSTQHQRALVDHELCHCKWKWAKDGSRKLYLAHHDLEEFTEIVERHGFWKRAVERMFRAMERGQTVIQFEDPRPDSPAAEAAEPRKTELHFDGTVSEFVDALNRVNPAKRGGR